MRQPPSVKPLPTPSTITPGAAVEPVVLIQPSSSVQDPAERTYFRRMAVKLAGWLEEAGIPVTLADDETAATLITRNTRAAILYSNQSLGSGEFQALSRLVGRGGKLLVFNAADPRLASLMGVRLSGRTLASRPGQWSAFRFTGDTPPGTPSRIEQDSLGLRPAFPDAPSSRPVAWWEDATGQRQPEPAWIACEHGFWMSHMLLEGDVPAKKRMLIALLGAGDPAILKAAAARAVATAGTLLRFPDASRAISAIGQLTRPHPADARINALLAQAATLHTELARQHRNGQYDQVITNARLLDTIVMEAYARTAAPRPGEFRGVWNHSGTGLYPGNWEATCRILSDHGITAVFPHVQRPWCAHYTSRLLPPSSIAASMGDQLSACLAPARKHGLEVHAWVICWNLDGAPANLIAAYRRDGRLQVSSKGEPLDWLCPSDPRNRAFQLNIIREVASLYPVTGIHLDYIRYHSRDYCYCPGCRQRFVTDTGAAIRRWPADVLQPGPRADAFLQWRRNRLTSWVKELRRELKRVAPACRLSAAVYPGYPGCRDSIGQDWGEWARQDLLDSVFPMNYSRETTRFAQWCRTQAELPDVRRRLYPGIGVTANESRLDAASVIDQIAVIRGESLPGFILFDANRTLEKDTLPFLRMGATAPP